ncbi:hypothetical protein DFP93_12138 [Aneurinibacillus soli]|uniref:Uncharacterized protein n=1 Tax=Aneurinibacillus soli TaxID=1500254 RepID=A0A0U5B6S0_9BACL|nr:hypothetical protein DFP93_12138 [Aneurinibacillus soli]BAU26652.1 hypothetical protein CB4_00794 [Aneurinibacillus soli]
MESVNSSKDRGGNFNEAVYIYGHEHHCAS